MDDQNKFLNTYKEKAGLRIDGQNQEASPAEVTPPSMRYEEKSNFVEPSGQTDYDSQPKGIQTKNIIIAVIAAVIVLGLIGGLIWFFNRGVEVIDLIGFKISDAQIWAQENDVKLQVAEEYNDRNDAGIVFYQDPLVGQTVNKGGFIKIKISKGHDLTIELDLPNLLTMTKDQIEAWAAENFMSKVRITSAYSNDIPLGNVISFTINDETVVDRVKRDTPVYVIVSKGPEDLASLQVTVPDFKAITIAQGYQFASENGITLNVIEQYDDYMATGSVISQSVKATEKVAKGTIITLVVSKGKKIIMPDFSVYSKAQAAVVVQELGIIFTSAEKYSGYSVNSFISQSIAAGSVYEAGQILELVYSLGNKIVLPSYVGQTRDAIETWAKGLNEQGASIKISVTFTKSSSPQGQIIYQEPSGTVIGTRATVSITISLGKVVFMPSFVAPAGSGYDLAITRDEAMTMCSEQNIVPVFVAESTTGRLHGEIWFQSVAAGTEINENSTVTLKYNPANVNVTVPNFLGMTKAEIIAAGYLNQLDIEFVDAEIYVEGYGDKVCQQSLASGTLTVAGTAVTLTVSPPAPTPTPTSTTP